MIPAPPLDCAYENYPLAPLTLYKVGGPARLALRPRTAAEAERAYAWMAAQDCPRMVLGGGSNVLIADAGFPGIVLLTTGLAGIEDVGKGRYIVETGVVLDELVRAIMLRHNYAGVGGLTGIPGTVGGAIYMNAGTVNGSTCELMEWVEVVGAGGLRRTAMAPDLYSYRGQSFCGRGELIVRGQFAFQPAEEPQQPIYDHYIQRRKEKQPQGNCCGSVFKNPPGEHAGRLIEACGLKGTRAGGAVISPLHANFIMNEDKASAEDILALIRLCKDRVYERFGIALEEEVVVIR